MAYVVPQRSKYKPRHIVEYVKENIMYLRSNCEKMTNPNTPAQQCYRSRFALIHQLQRGITPLFRQGFYRQRSGKNRWVGAFHVAQGHNMNEAALLQEDGHTWRCDFSRFTICEHRSKAPKRMVMQRKGHLLIFSYHWSGQAERTGILWAVYNRKRKQWVHGIINTRLTGQVTTCAIPPAWETDPLEVLVGFGMDAEGRGKLRGTHHFSFAESEGIVTVRGMQRSLTHPAGASRGWRVVGYRGQPWIELIDAQGGALQVRVYYLIV